MWWKRFVHPNQLFLMSCANIKVGWSKKRKIYLLTKKDIKGSEQKLQTNCSENRIYIKQLTNKWMEIGFNLCDRPVRCRLNEMEVTYRKTKWKPAIKHKGNKMHWREPIMFFERLEECDIQWWIKNSHYPRWRCSNISLVSLEWNICRSLPEGSK